jgi:hypothetical protein
MSKPRPEFLKLAENCGAKLTGKPDGSEAITIVFSIGAWRAFDAAALYAAQPEQAQQPHAAGELFTCVGEIDGKNIIWADLSDEDFENIDCLKIYVEVPK